MAGRRRARAGLILRGRTYFRKIDGHYRPVNSAYEISRVIEALQQARDWAGTAPQTLARIRLALSSAYGAQRHAAARGGAEVQPMNFVRISHPALVALQGRLRGIAERSHAINVDSIPDATRRAIRAEAEAAIAEIDDWLTDPGRQVRRDLARRAEPGEHGRR